MSFKLRKYQRDALDALHVAIQVQDILLLQAATGAGKTVMVARMINKYFFDHPHRTFLIVMHKKELVEQFIKAFHKFTDIPAMDIGIACAGLSKTITTDRRVVIASVQTLAKRLDVYGGADLVVVDETHRIGHDQESQYRSFLDTLRTYKPDHKIIGVTATAYRLGHGMIYGANCRPGRENFFPELTHRVTYKELVQDGHLMPLKGYVATDEGTVEDLSSIKLSAGEYNIGEAGRVMSRHVESAVDAYEQYGGNHTNVAVFACTIDHCERLKDAFTARGYSACVIHSQLSPVEREANIKGWQQGKYNFAISVNILVEGFDFPGLSCMIMCRPTKSPVVFVQAIGRILRMMEGKEEALLIDLTTNVLDFGLDLDNPKFNIPKMADGEGEAPTKVCPGVKADGSICGALLHPAVIICPDCDYEWPVEEVNKTMGVMTEVEFQNEPDPPEWHDVSDMQVFIHTNNNTGKSLLRIKLQLGGGYLSREASVWICCPDHYSGFAVEVGKEKWEEFTTEEYPDTVEEAEFLSGTFKQPTQVLCAKDDNGYLNVQDYNFAPIPMDGRTVDDIQLSEVPF